MEPPIYIKTKTGYERLVDSGEAATLLKIELQTLQKKRLYLKPEFSDIRVKHYRYYVKSEIVRHKRKTNG